MQAVEIDVSDLPPPEPMKIICSQLAHLPLKHCLKIHHRRLPRPLFKTLVESNWHYSYQQIETIENNLQHYLIYIYRTNERQLFEQSIYCDQLQQE